LADLRDPESRAAVCQPRAIQQHCDSCLIQKVKEKTRRDFERNSNCIKKTTTKRIPVVFFFFGGGDNQLFRQCLGLSLKKDRFEKDKST